MDSIDELNRKLQDNRDAIALVDRDIDRMRAERADLIAAGRALVVELQNCVNAASADLDDLAVGQ